MKQVLLASVYLSLQLQCWTCGLSWDGWLCRSCKCAGLHHGRARDPWGLLLAGRCIIQACQACMFSSHRCFSLLRRRGIHLRSLHRQCPIHFFNNFHYSPFGSEITTVHLNIPWTCLNHPDQSVCHKIL